MGNVPINGAKSPIIKLVLIVEPVKVRGTCGKGHLFVMERINTYIEKHSN